MRLVRCLAWMAVAALLLPLTSSAQQDPTGQPPMSAEQQAMMQAWMAAMTPGAPHASLAERAGQWTTKITLWMEPGAPPTESTGTAQREMTLGGRVLVEKFQSSFMGMPMEGMGLGGYDNITGKYWSTWTDNMSTGLMRSEGTPNADGTVTYHGSMLDPVSKQPIPVRFEVSTPSKDKDTMEMFETRDGQERKTMVLVYDRVK